MVVLAPQANPTPIHVRLKGLREDACYQELIFGKTYSGAALMHGGFTLPIMSGDYPSLTYHFKIMQEH